MKKPIISVVIPAYNEEKYIGQALKSLQKQDFENFEVIVVDNGSTDKTAAISRKLGAIIVKEPKKGVVFARQTGFLKAKGEIIATTDADTILPENWLKNVDKTFAQNPKAVAVTGLYDFYDSGIIFRIQFALILRLLFLTSIFYSGANLVIKKESFEKIGGFNFDYTFGEDAEICQRLKKIGLVVRSFSNPVKTSNRRYRKTGVLGSTWDYFKLYLRVRMKNGLAPVFEPGSTLKNMTFRKIFDYLLLLLVIFFIFSRIK